jgi:hypothetical protein
VEESKNISVDGKVLEEIHHMVILTRESKGSFSFLVFSKFYNEYYKVFIK